MSKLEPSGVGGAHRGATAHGRRARSAGTSRHVTSKQSQRYSHQPQAGAKANKIKEHAKNIKD